MGSTLPKISVITPSFNQGQFLRATMESVHSQTYKNFEHIVIDGGSTDNSIEIIREYSSKLTCWTSEPDGGHCNGLIKGFTRATGDILCWLNSDDVFEPGALQEVANFFQLHPDAHVVYGDSTWVDRAGQAIRPKKEHPFSWFIWMNDHNFIPQPSTFWTRKIYDKAGGLDPAFTVACDGDLWARFARLTKLHHVRRKWSCMRLYDEQRGQTLRRISDREAALIRSRYRSPGNIAWQYAMWCTARSMRLAWKAATGCYLK